jgi:DNA primase
MDPREAIYEELTSDKVPGGKKIAGDSFMICCPFHDDSTPSCGINLAQDTNLPLGTFNCFGCGARGNWNRIAEKLGLKIFKDWELGFKDANIRKRDKRADPTFKSREEQIKQLIRTQESIEWPVSLAWRGYRGPLIKKLDAIYYNDWLTKQMMLFFPVTVMGKLRGGVRAYMEKQVSGSNYLTTKGSWVKRYGLLGYEYTKKIVRANNYDALVLVEGPRDVLRLLDNGIPALATLGALTVSEQKIINLLSISSKLKTLYVMPDNDKGGSILYSKIKQEAGELIKVKRLKLPRPTKNGKLIKIDPDSCDQDIINEVKFLLDNHKT